MPHAEDPAAGAVKDQPNAPRTQATPMVFLAGPPGSGKSALGRRVCADLGLRLLDLVDVGSTAAALQEVVRAGGADVVTLPWAPARDSGWLDLCRRSGETVALWAHPLDMQARSGHAEPLFTPVKRLKTRGGFGRNGTACSEYRHLARACQYVLLLVDVPEQAAAQELKSLVEYLRSSELSPVEREGLLGWCEDWRRDFDADARACEILVEAMARFTLHLKAQGASPRTMDGIRTDLNAAGFLLMRNSAPKGKAVLDLFGSGPSEYEFRRMISDSPRAAARFRSTCEAFYGFLRDSRMIGRSRPSR